MFFELNVAEYDLAKTLECGQVFRYKRLKENSYYVYSRDKQVKITQVGSTLTMQSTSSSLDELPYWKRYFNLGFRNDELASAMSKQAFLAEVYQYNRGLRILRQDPWECLVSFIISQQKRIPQIQSSIEALCELAGKSCFGYTKYHAFPTALEVYSADLSSIKLGYREQYVKSAAKAYLDGWLNFDDLYPSKNTYADAGHVLCDIYGVGLKIANCVLLFGLGYTEAFPVDTHIKKVLALPSMKDFDYEVYGKDAGIVQQYLYNWALNHGL